MSYWRSMKYILRNCVELVKNKKSMKELLDKELVARRFKSCIATYEENATVQKEISRQLFNLLYRFECIDYSRLLEIGCCTGVLTEMIASRQIVADLWVNDIVDDFCRVTCSRIKDHIIDCHFLPGDIEEEDLPEELSLVVSSSTFQWMNNLSELIKKISESLKSGGHLAFSIFGPGTMRELSSLTGRSLPYLSEKELLLYVEKYLHIIHIHKENKCIYFPSVRDVLRHIQKTGVGGVAKYSWTISKLKEFENLYESNFGTDLGIPVTYKSIFIIGEKPKS